MHGVLQTAQISTSGMGKSLQAALLHYRTENWSWRRASNSSWSPKTRNLPALAQLELSRQWCCGETLQQLTSLSFRFETLSLHLVYDLWICSSSLSSGSLEQTGLIRKMNASYLEEHFLRIQSKKQNTPAGRRVRANPCCAATLQRELILLQFQTASQSFSILIHSML